MSKNLIERQASAPDKPSHWRYQMPFGYRTEGKSRLDDTVHPWIAFADKEPDDRICIEYAFTLPASAPNDAVAISPQRYLHSGNEMIPVHPDSYDSGVQEWVKADELSVSAPRGNTLSDFDVWTCDPAELDAAQPITSAGEKET